LGVCCPFACEKIIRDFSLESITSQTTYHLHQMKNTYKWWNDCVKLFLQKKYKMFFIHPVNTFEICIQHFTINAKP
jgi:hypothetical protein